MVNNFNNDSLSPQALSIGDEIEVLVTDNSSNLLQLIQSDKKDEKKPSKSKGLAAVELSEGIRFQGSIKSIKNQTMYVQVPTGKASKEVVIGRLHMIECQNTKEFEQYTVGDKVEAKILKITKDEAKGRTWVELTRRKAHLNKTLGLNQDELKTQVKGVDDLIHA